MSAPVFSSFRVLGARLDGVSRNEALRFVEQELALGRSLQIITANPLMMDLCSRDAELTRAFEGAALCVPDSIGAVWIARLKGFPMPGRIPGIELMEDFCALAEEKGGSVYLLGGEPGAAEETRAALLRRHPRLSFAGARDGFFADSEEPRIVAEIRAARPRFLFVALGVPRQEKWIARHLSQWPGVCAMGVGGSFDVLSGRLRRAPNAFRALGLEWLYRLGQEPWRWRRVARLPLAFLRCILSR